MRWSLGVLQQILIKFGLCRSELSAVKATRLLDELFKQPNIRQSQHRLQFLLPQLYTPLLEGLYPARHAQASSICMTARNSWHYWLTWQITMRHRYLHECAKGMLHRLLWFASTWMCNIIQSFCVNVRPLWASASPLYTIQGQCKAACSQGMASGRVHVGIVNLFANLIDSNGQLLVPPISAVSLPARNTANDIHLFHRGEAPSSQRYTIEPKLAVCCMQWCLSIRMIFCKVLQADQDVLDILPWYEQACSSWAMSNVIFNYLHRVLTGTESRKAQQIALPKMRWQTHQGLSVTPMCVDSKLLHRRSYRCFVATV